MKKKKIIAGLLASSIACYTTVPTVYATEISVLSDESYNVEVSDFDIGSPITAQDESEPELKEMLGLSMEEIESSEVKPIITLSREIVSVDEAGEYITVELKVSGADNAYSATTFHIYYDDRLEIEEDSVSGYPLAELGEAGKYLISDIPYYDVSAESYNDEYTKFTGVNGVKGLFLTTVGSKDFGRDGVLWRMNFRIPSDAKEGDVFPLDIKFRSAKNAVDTFTNSEDDKKMQAYAFTKGINNGITSKFSVSDEEISSCVSLAEYDNSFIDGYIAIEKEPEPETTTTAITTTTTSTTSTTTTQTTTTTTAAETTTTVTTTFVGKGDGLKYIVYGDYVRITGSDGTETKVVIPDEIGDIPVKEIDYAAFRNCTKLESVVLPKSITEIRSSTFEGCKNLKSVVIPEGVESIGGSAFSGCESLESIVIPEGVTEINSSTFSHCKNLKSVVIPESVTEIKWGAFNGCESLESVVIPDSVTKIDSSIFEGCKSLESVELSENITKINSTVFINCTNLKSIKIPKNVEVIDSTAFQGCTSLEEFIVDEENRYYYSYDGAIYKRAYEEEYDTDLYETPPYTDIFYLCPNGKKGVFEIKDGTKVIGDSAFTNCKFLESVVIPESVKYINYYAFASCTSLESIKIPEGIENIGVGVFSNCTSLKSVIIPESVTKIENRAFADCTSLESIKIPESVTSIEGGAFSNCSSLEYIEIPENVTYIGSGAFSCCSGLKSLKISKNVEEIGNIWDMENLEEIIVEEGNSNYYSYDGALYTNNYKEYKYNHDKQEYEEVIYNALIYCPKNKQGKFEIKEGTEYISDAFKECSGITSLSIPASVKYIYTLMGLDSLEEITVDEKNPVYYSYDGALYKHAKENFSDTEIEQDMLLVYPMMKKGAYTVKDGTNVISWNAFEGCKGVTSVTLPDSIISLRDRSFYGCENLESINFHDGVTEIGNSAFYGCKKLERVDIPDGVKKISDSVFEDCTSLKKINIPKTVEQIRDFASGCTSLEEINVDEENPKYYSYDGVLYTNALETYYNYETDEWEERECNMLIICPVGKQGECTVKDGVDRINYYAFEGCKGITSITLPESLKTIEEYAFSGCESLESLDIPENVDYLGKFFCDGCTSLKEINVDSKNSVYFSYDGILYKNDYYYGYGAYSGAAALVCPQGKTGDIVIKDGTKVIIAYAFECIKDMTSVTSPDSVVLIEDGWGSGSTISNGCEYELIEDDYYSYYIPHHYYNGKINASKGKLGHWYADYCGYEFVPTYDHIDTKLD